MPRRLAIELGALLVAIAAALLVRSYVASVYAIPSESMLPALAQGDYVLVEKQAFAPAGEARLPTCGEIVLFRAPPSGRRTYVKRVIGLPGDMIAIRAGTLSINGRRVPRWRIADRLVPVAANAPCHPGEAGWPRPERLADGSAVCRAPRYRELLPGGALVDTLDLGAGAGDEFGPITVPRDRLFVLGDDRDRSEDSRWPAREGGPVGFVPRANLIGRARVVLFSVDGSARLADPASWLRAIRWQRIGTGF